MLLTYEDTIHIREFRLRTGTLPKNIHPDDYWEAMAYHYMLLTPEYMEDLRLMGCN